MRAASSRSAGLPRISSPSATVVSAASTGPALGRRQPFPQRARLFLREPQRVLRRRLARARRSRRCRPDAPRVRHVDLPQQFAAARRGGREVDRRGRLPSRAVSRRRRSGSSRRSATSELLIRQTCSAFSMSWLARSWSVPAGTRSVGGHDDLRETARSLDPVERAFDAAVERRPVELRRPCDGAEAQHEAVGDRGAEQRLGRPAVAWTVELGGRRGRQRRQAVGGDSTSPVGFGRAWTV